MARISPPTAAAPGRTDRVTSARPIVAVERPGRADVAALLARHEGLMRGQTPADSCHVKFLDEISASRVRLFTLREAGRLLAIGALVPLAPGHEEIKSMHVAETARGRGAGRVLLNGMLADARGRDVGRVSLETGSTDAHAAARALYAGAGFAETGPFGNYADDPLSIFMTTTP